MSTISVIIPAYNLSTHLEQAVSSALQQTYPPLEILIVENNSTDDTGNIARSLQATHPALVRVLYASPQGAPYARNLGLLEAKGEWIQYLDGDDLLLSQKLERQLFHIGPHIGFVAGSTIEKDIAGRTTTRQVMQDVWRGLFTGGGHLGFTSSNLWNAAALRAVHGWDTTLARNQEYDLMFRLLQHGFHCATCNEALTIKQQRTAGQISDVAYTEFLKQSIRLRHRMLAYLLQHPLQYQGNLSGFLKFYFSLYARLRVRDAAAAKEMKTQYYDRLFIPSVRRQYPLVHYLQVRAELYALVKSVKGLLGHQGILGRIKIWLSGPAR